MATTADVDGKEATKSIEDEGTKRGGVKTLMMKIMIKHPEICLMTFAIVLTLLSRYTKSSPDRVFTTQSPPRSFFPSSSVVIDFPYGNLEDVLEIVAEEEVLVAKKQHKLKLVAYYDTSDFDKIGSRKGRGSVSPPRKNEHTMGMFGALGRVGCSCWFSAICRLRSIALRNPRLIENLQIAQIQQMGPTDALVV
ncbi:hypothetical protein LSAT2_021105 [Lamellibrachia satsuma]|nr:hypothetical protein LSAT2_021105 [Lamellibrachia satsuma]